MRILKIFLIALVVTGTATVATINVVLNSNAPIVSNWTLQNMEAFTGNETSENSPADDANNSSGPLWQEYYYNCVIKEKVVVNGSCATVSAGTYYCTPTQADALVAQIVECNIQYTRTEDEAGIKKYCFDGWEFCLENTTCH